MGILYTYVLLGCIFFPVMKHIAMKKKTETDTDIVKYLSVTFATIALWTFCEWIPFFPYPSFVFALLITFLLNNPVYAQSVYDSLVEPIAQSQEDNIEDISNMLAEIYANVFTICKSFASQNKDSAFGYAQKALEFVKQNMGIISKLKGYLFLKKKESEETCQMNVENSPVEFHDE